MEQNIQYSTAYYVQYSTCTVAMAGAATSVGTHRLNVPRATCIIVVITTTKIPSILVGINRRHQAHTTTKKDSVNAIDKGWNRDSCRSVFDLELAKILGARSSARLPSRQANPIAIRSPPCRSSGSSLLQWS
jgi:hypothetical protein